MKFLLAADIHFHNYKPFSRREDGYNSRLLRIFDAMMKIRDRAADGDIDAIFLLGDIFHRRGLLDVDVINKAYLAMRRLAQTAPLVILAGNHDQMSKDGGITSLEVFSDIPNTTIVLGPVVMLDFEGAAFHLHPYTDDIPAFKEKIREWTEGVVSNVPRFLLTHMGVSGATVGPYEYEPHSPIDLNDLNPRAWTSTFMGHYHKRQHFRMPFSQGPGSIPKEKIVAMYVGSLLQHNFSEQGEEKVFLEVDVQSKDNVLITDHLTGQPQFYDFDKYPGSDLQFVLSTGNYARLSARNSEHPRILAGIPEEHHYRLDLLPKPEMESTEDPVRKTKIRLETPLGAAIIDYVDERWMNNSNGPSGDDLKAMGQEILREAEATHT